MYEIKDFLCNAPVTINQGNTEEILDLFNMASHFDKDQFSVALPHLIQACDHQYKQKDKAFFKYLASKAINSPQSEYYHKVISEYYIKITQDHLFNELLITLASEQLFSDEIFDAMRHNALNAFIRNILLDRYDEAFFVHQKLDQSLPYLTFWLEEKFCKIMKNALKETVGTLQCAHGASDIIDIYVPYALSFLSFFNHYVVAKNATIKLFIKTIINKNTMEYATHIIASIVDETLKINYNNPNLYSSLIRVLSEKRYNDIASNSLGKNNSDFLIYMILDDKNLSSKNKSKEIASEIALKRKHALLFTQMKVALAHGFYHHFVEKFLLLINMDFFTIDEILNLSLKIFNFLKKQNRLRLLACTLRRGLEAGVLSPIKKQTIQEHLKECFIRDDCFYINAHNYFLAQKFYPAILECGQMLFLLMFIKEKENRTNLPLLKKTNSIFYDVCFFGGLTNSETIAGMIKLTEKNLDGYKEIRYLHYILSSNEYFYNTKSYGSQFNKLIPKTEEWSFIVSNLWYMLNIAKGYRDKADKNWLKVLYDQNFFLAWINARDYLLNFDYICLYLQKDVIGSQFIYLKTLFTTVCYSRNIAINLMVTLLLCERDLHFLSQSYSKAADLDGFTKEPNRFIPTHQINGWKPTNSFNAILQHEAKSRFYALITSFPVLAFLISRDFPFTASWLHASFLWKKEIEITQSYITPPLPCSLFE